MSRLLVHGLLVPVVCLGLGTGTGKTGSYDDTVQTYWQYEPHQCLGGNKWAEEPDESWVLRLVNKLTIVLAPVQCPDRVESAPASMRREAKRMDPLVMDQ